MKIGKFEIPWSDVGKIAAGAVTVVASCYIFMRVSGWMRIAALAVLVVLFLLYRHLSAKRRMSPQMEETLKDEDSWKKYG